MQTEDLLFAFFEFTEEPVEVGFKGISMEFLIWCFCLDIGDLIQECIAVLVLGGGVVEGYGMRYGA